MLFCFLFLRKYLYISSYRGQSLKYKLISYYVSLVLFKSIRIILFDNSAKENKVILKTFFFFWDRNFCFVGGNIEYNHKLFFFFYWNLKGEKKSYYWSLIIVCDRSKIFSASLMYISFWIFSAFICVFSHIMRCVQLRDN